MRLPDKILVLSLTRMGDIVQSIPFVRRLRLQNPDAEIHVLVEQCFADVAAFLPDVAAIRTVRLEDLLPALETGRRRNLQTATRFYRDFVADLRAESYDQVWNLTHTRPATVLNYLLTAERGCGVTLDRNGFQRVNDPWLTYFFAANLARPWCQFNLVDIYANCVQDVPWAAGRSLCIDPAAYAAVRSPFPETAALLRIAVHPGASQPAKQWPLHRYRQLIEQLTRRADVEVLLIGGPKDAKIAAEFHGFPRVRSLIGKTTPTELALALSQCRILISNDSGPMHVAAGVGTRTIAITVGSALGSETAPYGDGHLVIEPDNECFPCPADKPCANPVCGARITAETVLAAVAWELKWAGEPLERELTGARIYRTEISKTDGLLDLRRLFTADVFARDRLNSIVRTAWLAALEPQQKVSPRGAELPASLQPLWREARLSAIMLRGLASQLSRAAQFAGRRMTTIVQLGELIRMQEARLEQIMRRHSLLQSLWIFGEISRASLPGDDLTRQAAATATIYDRLSRLLQTMQHEPSLSTNELSIETVIEEHHENPA